MHLSTHWQYHHHGSYIKREPQICSLSISYFTEEILAVSYYATYLPCLDYPMWPCQLSINQLVLAQCFLLKQLQIWPGWRQKGGGRVRSCVCSIDWYWSQWGADQLHRAPGEHPTVGGSRDSLILSEFNVLSFQNLNMYIYLLYQIRTCKVSILWEKKLIYSESFHLQKRLRLQSV